jgi:hypothetical protein
MKREREYLAPAPTSVKTSKTLGAAHYSSGWMPNPMPSWT